MDHYKMALSCTVKLSFVSQREVTDNHPERDSPRRSIENVSETCCRHR